MSSRLLKSIHGPKVLVVGREPGILMTCELVLQRAGFEVWTASSGK